jgi:nucleoside-diphosphate-sugar epimerase
MPVLRGDATKAREAVGWQPEIPFEQTLRDILAHWRGRV